MNEPCAVRVLIGAAVRAIPVCGACLGLFSMDGEAAAEARHRDAAFTQTAHRYALAWVRGPHAARCPAERDAQAAVEQRVGRAVFATPATRLLEVLLTRSGQQWSSQIYIGGAEGQRLGGRSLYSTANDCQSLFEATVLALALVIDPEAATRTAELQHGEVPVPTSTEPASSQSEHAGAPQPSRREPLGSEKSEPRSPRTGGLLVVNGLWAFGVLPEAGPGVEVATRLGREHWRVQLGAGYLAPRGLSDEGVNVDVSLTFAHLSGHWVHSRQAVSFAIGAGVQVGAQHVAVRALSTTQPGERLWLGAQLGGQARLHLGRGWLAALGARAVVPVRAPELGVGDGDGGFRSLFEPSPVAGLVSLGVGHQLF